MKPMNESSMRRRDLLACLPAFIAAPMALAQGVTPPPGGAAAPMGGMQARPRTGKASGSEGVTIPFAMAACWADDYGALASLRLIAKLDCTIATRCARSPIGDDEYFTLFISAGAALECIGILATASMAGTAVFYPKIEEGGDLVVMSVRVGQVKKQPTPDALASALGIFTRPDPRGAFDAAYKPEVACVEKARISLIDQNTTGVVIADDKRAEFMKAVETLAAASPAFAAAIGPKTLWGPGCTIVLAGRGPTATTQTLINAGRGMQKAGLFAHQYGAAFDVRPLPPGLFEAASAKGAEQAAAAKVIAAALEAPGFEPMALCRLGKLTAPQPRAVPPAMQILSASMEAPAIAPNGN